MSSPQCFENPPKLTPDYGAGTVQELGGLKTYVTGASDSKLAILLIADAFGKSPPSPPPFLFLDFHFLRFDFEMGFLFSVKECVYLENYYTDRPVISSLNVFFQVMKLRIWGNIILSFAGMKFGVSMASFLISIHCLLTLLFNRPFLRFNSKGKIKWG